MPDTMTIATGSVLLDFRLPNATSWFYASLLLAITLFFRFGKPLTLRNWDLVMLYLLVPGLLFLREARELKHQATEELQRHVAAAAAQLAPSVGAGPLAASPALQIHAAMENAHHSSFLVFLGYLLLLTGTAYYLGRCLVDAAIVRRPAFVTNVHSAGMVFLIVCLGSILVAKSLLPVQDMAPAGSLRSTVVERATVAASLAAEKVQRDMLEIPAPRLEQMLEQVRTGLALCCHALVVAGLYVIGAWIFRNNISGLAASLLYVLLPYTAYHVKSLEHALPAAVLVGALLCYRWPTVSGLVLGIGASTVYFPVLLLPIWASFYWRRGIGRFVTAFCLPVLAVVSTLAFKGELVDEVVAAMHLPDWRAWDLRAVPSGESVWTGMQLHYAYRVPIFIGYLVLVFAGTLWPRPKNLAHLLALSAAVILGVQFWYGDAGGIYVLWYLPLLILMTVRPSLVDHVALIIAPDDDWIWQLKRRLGSLWRRRPLQRVEV